MRIFPIALIVVGLVFLLRNLGVIPHDVLRTWWPLFLIAAGAIALLRYSRHCKGVDARQCCGEKNCSKSE